MAIMRDSIRIRPVPRFEGLLPCPVCGSDRYSVRGLEGDDWVLRCEDHYWAIGKEDGVIDVWNDPERRRMAS